MTDLLIIGSAAGVPTEARFCTALALRTEQHLYLIDAGAPVSTLLYRMYEDPLKVDAVFLSHMHTDHVAGLPLLLQHNHLLHRRKPLAIYGPWDTARRLRCLLHDLLLGVDRLSFPLSLHDVTLGQPVTLSDLTVAFFPTTHYLGFAPYAPQPMSCGLVVETGNKRLVISGDLGRQDDLVPYLKGCDILLHEFGHWEVEEIADFAALHRVPHLVVYHLHHDWDRREEEMQVMIRKRYGGKLTLARDLMRVQL